MHKMVPAEGFEPPTTRLRSGCSTAELRRLKTAPLISMQPTIGKQYGLCRSSGDQRNSLRNRCQTSLSRDVDISGTGSTSAPGSGPGSSGACTSGITGSTSFRLAGVFDLAALREGISDAVLGFVSGAWRVIASTAGGVASITGLASPISASGTFHSNPSRRPFGDTGSQCSETAPSAVHAGSPDARMARAIHSRTRP